MLLAVRDYLRGFDVDLTRLSYGRSHDGRLKLLIKKLGIDCVLDVGANQGQFAKSLRTIGYKGRIVSFEPAEEPFKQLRDRSKRDPLWSVRQQALGSSDTVAALNVMQNSTLNSFHRPSEYGCGECTGEVIDHVEAVTVARLDSTYPNLGEIRDAKRIFLKIDTQGHDLEVFRGAAGCLSKVALIQLELSVNPIYEGTPTWNEAIEEVRANGFALGGMFAVSYDSDQRAIEFDGIFVRCGQSQVPVPAL